MILPVNLLAGLALLCARATGAPFQRSSSVSTTFFGGAKTTAFSILDLPRGGEEVVAEAEPEVLYLPGLLDVELKKSKQVSCLEQLSLGCVTVVLEFDLIL